MNKKLFLILVAVTAAIATSPGLMAADAVYKWVDDDGAVHFGAHVPDGFKGTRIDLQPNTVNTVRPVKKEVIDTDLPATAVPGMAESDIPELSIAEQKRQTRAENRRKNAEEAQKRENECAIMHQQKATIEPSTRVMVDDGNGEMRRLDDEERADTLKEANDFIAKNCN
jgi:hypothetical protein